MNLYSGFECWIDGMIDLSISRLAGWLDGGFRGRLNEGLLTLV